MSRCLFLSSRNKLVPFYLQITMTRSLIKIILQRRGCANRPFFHITAQYRYKLVQEDPIEQIGTYDPMPNLKNEKLAAINFERLRYYIGTGAKVSLPVAHLLGRFTFLFLHLASYVENKFGCILFWCDFRIMWILSNSSTDVYECVAKKKRETRRGSGEWKWGICWNNELM